MNYLVLTDNIDTDLEWFEKLFGYLPTVIKVTPVDYSERFSVNPELLVYSSNSHIARHYRGIRLEIDPYADESKLILEPRGG